MCVHVYKNVCILPLGTVGNRFTRLKATKHACNREEVKIVKELGGTEWYFCTLVALPDVERYFEKYEDNKEKLKECEKKQGLDKNETKKKEKRVSSKGDACKKSTSKSLLPEENSLDVTTTQADNDSQELSTVERHTSISPEQDTQKVGKKRKRRTQFEMLQVYQFYTDVTENENHKRKRSSLSDSDVQQFEADSAMSVDINSNIIEDQNISPERPQEAMFDYDKLDLPYSDDNNNGSDSIEPRSPTLLLKRSQNNKWHVAKAVLPQFNLDVLESEKTSDMTVKPKTSKNSARSKAAMTKVKNKLKGLRKSSSAASANETKEPSAKKVKLNEGMNPLASLKKLGKKGLKKVKKSTVKRKNTAATVDKQKETAKLVANTKSDKAITDKNPENSDTTPASVQQNTNGRKGSLFPKESTDSLNKTPIENKEKRENGTKNDGAAVKKKRRRRVEINSFRLIETIPYSSLLVVKDGDLCPSFTMAYNQQKNLPGCCHALWRWRLGKPLRIPSHSPIKSKEDQYPFEKKQDDLSPNTTTKVDKISGCFEANQDENSRMEKTPDNFAVGKGADGQVRVPKRLYEEFLVEKRSDELLAIEKKPVEHLPIDKVQEGQLSVEKRPDEQLPNKKMTDDLFPTKEMTDEQFPINEMRDGHIPVKGEADGQFQIKKMQEEQFPPKEKPVKHFPIEIKPVEQFRMEKGPKENLDERKMDDPFKARTSEDRNSPDGISVCV